MTFRMLSTPVALAVATILVLTGCIPAAPVITPPPVPSETPVFASDEEALAAATEAYRKYLAVSDEIFLDGGADPIRLSQVLTGEKLKSELESFAEFAAKGLTGVGMTRFEGIQLQQYDRYSITGEREVVVYLCEDVSETDVFDTSGKSVVSDGRPDRVLYEVAFDAVPPTSKTLVVSDKQPWSDKPC